MQGAILSVVLPHPDIFILKALISYLERRFMDKKTEKDRRLSERIRHQVLVYVEQKEGYFPTRDLSEQGCLIDIPDPPPEGTELDLVLLLPGDKTIKVRGRVKHTGNENNCAGIEFTDLGFCKKLYFSFLNGLKTIHEAKALYDTISEQPGKKKKSQRTVQKTASAFTVLKTILVVLVLVSFFIGVAKHHFLENNRKEIAKRMADIRGSVVITMVHRQETVGLLGIPMKQYIKVEDAESILRAIRSTPPDKPIDMIIHTPGGILFSAYQIARALKEHKGRVTVFIPHYAMSGGTLIALGADKIVMDKDAIIGPVDPQLVEAKITLPAVSLINLPQLKNWNDIDDSTIVMIDQAKKSLQQVKEMVTSLLADHTTPEQLQKILDRLVGGHVTHDYPIFPEDAKKLGLPVSMDMPAEVYELMALYPQPSKRSITRTN
ncbi:MAG TPA: hypothetical protein ENI41_06395 [Deltaproteobacteria bacterium]|nr:hypothetical protein [Deltaproteobacteria bacterium]